MEKANLPSVVGYRSSLRYRLNAARVLPGIHLTLQYVFIERKEPKQCQCQENQKWS